MLVKCKICNLYLKVVPSDYKRKHKECSDAYRTLRANRKNDMIKKFNRLTSKDKTTFRYISRTITNPTDNQIKDSCKYYNSSYKRIITNIELLSLGDDYDYFKNLDLIIDKK